MNLVNRNGLVKKSGSWSSFALISSFVLGMLFHRNASSSKNVISTYMKQFETRKGLTKRTNKFNSTKKQTATKIRTDKEEFDVNILFMN